MKKTVKEKEGGGGGERKSEKDQVCLKRSYKLYILILFNEVTMQYGDKIGYSFFMLCEDVGFASVTYLKAYATTGDSFS